MKLTNIKSIEILEEAVFKELLCHATNVIDGDMTPGEVKTVVRYAWCDLPEAVQERLEDKKDRLIDRAVRELGFGTQMKW